MLGVTAENKRSNRTRTKQKTPSTMSGSFELCVAGDQPHTTDVPDLVAESARS